MTQSTLDTSPAIGLEGRAKTRLLAIQPLLANYRRPLFAELAELYELRLISSAAVPGDGFDDSTTDRTTTYPHVVVPRVSLFGDRFYFQAGTLRIVRQMRPDAVFAVADLRSLTFWCLLVLCRHIGIPLFAHGHGLYRRSRPPLPIRLAYRLVLRLVTKYVCYADTCRESLTRLGGPYAHRTAVVLNTIYNSHPVSPRKKTGEETGILFLGRLRPQCNLELLLSAVEALRRTKGRSLRVEVVGGGPLESHYRNQYTDPDLVRWHGPVYDQETIARISKHCFAGCYPGHAGLSVVHLMSLSLPPIVHDRMDLHQGPEPSYITDRRNGLLYRHDRGSDGVLTALSFLVANPDLLGDLQKGAFKSYEELATPSYAQRLSATMNESLSVSRQTMRS